MKAAVEEVVRGQKSVAKEFDKRTMLRRYIQKYKAAADGEDVTFMPKYNARQVFTSEQEHLLAEYFIAAARYNYGHSPAIARRLAYDFATENGIEVPETWLCDCSAGEEDIRCHRGLAGTKQKETMQRTTTVKCCHM